MIPPGGEVYWPCGPRPLVGNENRWETRKRRGCDVELRKRDRVVNHVPPLQTATLLLPGSIPLEVCRIPAGEFWMGSREPNDGSIHPGANLPRHRVRIEQAYWLSQTPILMKAFRAFVKAHGLKRPSQSAEDPESVQTDWNTEQVTEDDQPAGNVTWLDAMAFCDWLNAARYHLDTNQQVHWPAELAECQATLPTEAEWERACRGVAGEQLVEQEYGSGEGATALERVGWFGLDSNVTKIASVRRKEASDWGLFDMHGLVWEWVLDEYRPDAYGNRNEITVDPLEGSGVEIDERWPNAMRVLRGGSWINSAAYCGSASRGRFRADIWNRNNGFRLAVVPGMRGRHSGGGQRTAHFAGADEG
jgi:formylglycine-generating enzyme required for sulfatase activity